MSDYTLYYFNYKGYAEGTRLLLNYLGIPFREENVDPEKNGWEKLPVGYDNVQRYIAAEIEYKMRERQTDLPLTWLCPVLQFNGKRLTEPASIGQYLAETHNKNLIPTSTVDQAKAVQYARFWTADIHGAFKMYQSIVHDIERMKKWDTWIEGFLRPRLVTLNKTLTSNEFIFNTVCWADFYLYNTIKMIQQLPSVQFDEFDTINAFTKKIESLVEINQYVEERREILWVKPFTLRQPYPPLLVSPVKQDIGDYPWERQQPLEE